MFFINRKINNQTKEKDSSDKLYEEFKQKRDNEFATDINFKLHKFVVSCKHLQVWRESDKGKHLSAIVSHLKPKDEIVQPKEATWHQAHSKESLNSINTNFAKSTINAAPVQRQSGALCGYHALYNALKSSKAINGEPIDSMIKSWRQRIVLKRAGFNQWKDIQKPEVEMLSRKLSLDNSDWLEEDEVAGLFDYIVRQRVSRRNNVTFIPDVYRYKNGRPGLDIDIINELTQVQNKIMQHPEDKYEHVFILGTMSEEYDIRNAHWIAVKQKIENGTVEYSVMDSLSFWGYNDVVNELVSLLHVKNDRNRFNSITDSEDERLKKLLQTIEFNALFKQRRYAYNNTSKGSDSAKVVINRIPTKLNELVDDIIQACINLIEETGGKSLYSSSGYIQPLELVTEALSNIKSCQNQEVTMKLNPVDSENLSDGITFKSTRLILTPEQLELMAELEQCIKRLK